MYLVNLDLNLSSFPSHITTLYRGGGEIGYREKKHSVPRVLAAIVAIDNIASKMEKCLVIVLLQL